MEIFTKGVNKIRLTCWGLHNQSPDCSSSHSNTFSNTSTHDKHDKYWWHDCPEHTWKTTGQWQTKTSQNGFHPPTYQCAAVSFRWLPPPGPCRPGSRPAAGLWLKSPKKTSVTKWPNTETQKDVSGGGMWLTIIPVINYSES